MGIAGILLGVLLMVLLPREEPRVAETNWMKSSAAAMGKVRRDVYRPDEPRAARYDRLYEHYVRLHDHFGRGGDDVMHALRHIRPREVARG